MILLVSNSLDFATDYIVARLLHEGAAYYRIDTDLVHQDRITLHPASRRLEIEGESQRIILTPENLQSILYRAPTHLRESSGGRSTPQELLARHQWTAFVRSLSIFEEVRWINHPARTFLAENKPYQLIWSRRR